MSLAISGLRTQCLALRKRIEEGRQIVAAAEEDLHKLEEALEVLERIEGQDRSDAKLPLFLPGSARMKDEVFRRALQTAGRPLKPAEIIQRVSPQLSRSYVYYLIAELKKAGELHEEDGKISLRAGKVVSQEALQ
ncbi:MAG: hypothetical protein WAK27_02465 [Candidatus Sulfotelmatobacter sp.]